MYETPFSAEQEKFPPMIRRLIFSFHSARLTFSALAVLLGLSASAPAQDMGQHDEVGQHIEIDFDELMADTGLKTRMVMNFPQVKTPPPADQELELPEGFEINVFAEGGFREPRNIVVAPNGDFFLTDSQANTIYVLRDADGDGKAEGRETFLTGLNRPFGIAFHPGYVYIANTNNVIRYRYEPGQTKASGEPEVVVPELPASGRNNHWTRNLIFNKDHTKLYISVGSASNIGIEPAERATILECNPDGSELRIYASGLRNPVGLAWNPATGELWTSVNERDLLGDELVPDYVTSVKEGGFYGWPWYFIGEHADPRMEGKGDPPAISETIVPDVLIQAHSAALGMTFYEGEMFPEEYRGDLFVAFHGSWNRSLRTGYKVVRVRFDDEGQPVGGYENFLIGWLPSPDSPWVWGRPVMVTEAPDGALLVVEDGANKVWRVSYSGTN